MKKLENQKEIIFNTAKEIITNQDADKFSIRMISRQCNIGMGTIYKYYGNKDDILLDITRDLWMSYISSIKSTSIVHDSFIAYVRFLFIKLEEYSIKFNYAVLSKELSTSFRKEGRTQHDKSQGIFISLIYGKLQENYELPGPKALLLADFIANNLLSIITNRQYKFDVFISVLSDLLEQYKEKK